MVLIDVPRGKRGGMLGDSRTVVGASYNKFISAHATPAGWPHLLKALCKSGFEWVYFGGVNGETTSQIASRVQAAIKAKLDFCVVYAGVNNNWKTEVEVSAALADMFVIYDELTAAGIYVFALSETPSPNEAYHWHKLALVFNHGLEAYWNSWRTGKHWLGVFVDIWYPLLDKKTGLGNPIYFNNDVHPNSAGGWVIAHHLLVRLSPWLKGPLRELVSDDHDIHSISPNSDQYCLDPILKGPVISVLESGRSSYAKGVLPARVGSLGRAPCELSVIPRSDGFGNNIRASIAGDSGEFCKLRFQLLNPKDFVVGSVWVIDADFTIERAVNLNTFQFGVVASGFSISNLGQLFPSGGIDIYQEVNLVFSTQPFLIGDAGLVDYAVFELMILGGVGYRWSALVNIGRISCRRIT